MKTSKLQSDRDAQSLTRKHSSLSVGERDLPKVSVLIVCYNERPNLDSLFGALASQEFASQIAEVLVADNGSTDGSYEKLSEIKKLSSLSLTFWQRYENNIGAARKQLVERASSEWVVFLDADCVPPNYWLEQLLKKAKGCQEVDDHFAGCGAGHHLPENNEFQVAANSLLKNTALHGFSAQSFDGKDIGRFVDHLPTTNAIFLKSALMSVGNFRSDFSKVGEDLDLGLRLTENGHNLYRFAEPAIVNDCAASKAEWAKRMFRFGTAQGLVFGRRSGFTLFFLMASLVTLALGLLMPPVFLIAAALLVLLSWSFANRVAKTEKAEHLWRPAFQITALTAPSYFFGFLNGLFKKLLAH